MDAIGRTRSRPRPTSPNTNHYIRVDNKTELRGASFSCAMPLAVSQNNGFSAIIDGRFPGGYNEILDNYLSSHPSGIRLSWVFGGSGHMDVQFNMKPPLETATGTRCR